MDVTIVRVTEAWKNPEYQIKVVLDDGREERFTEFSHSLSRLLTNTKDESARGLFSSAGGRLFSRADTTVNVELNGWSSDAPLSDLAKEIKRRVQVVNAAFDAVKVEKIEEITFSI